jgi:hypothetical protein
MKMKEALKVLGKNKSLQLAKAFAKQENMKWEEGIKYIFNANLKNSELVPQQFGSKNDSAENIIQKWVQKYKSGYEQRISKRTSNLPSTIADPIIDLIINLRLPALETASLEEIKYAHRLSMSAENIQGLLLEEYLAENLLAYGWHCAWGETIKKVDFCSEKGKLLQIKNRSNSENSSSSSVRDNTSIKKWFRVDALTGAYMWSELNKLFSTNKFSEKSFCEFVKTSLENNPGALPVEKDNSWAKK